MQGEVNSCMNFSQRPCSSGPGVYLDVLRRRWAIMLNLVGRRVGPRAIAGLHD